MKLINLFYTFFWIIYFPACVAFAGILDFDYSDEILAVAMMGLALVKNRVVTKDRRKWTELKVYIFIMAFYLIYSAVIDVTTRRGVLLDFLQQLRPYMVFYITWMLAPKINHKQKFWILSVMVLSSVVYMLFFFKKNSMGEESYISMIALTSAMAYYLFSNTNKKNAFISVLLVLLGLLGGKSKFMGQCIVFIALLFFTSKKISLKSTKTKIKLILLVGIVLFFTWTKFSGYYVEGFREGAEAVARPMSYKTGFSILLDYFPFGSGFGTFCTAAAAKEYSPLYYKYNLNTVWGMSPDFPDFIADCFYPGLAEYGLVGIILFVLFWRRRIIEVRKINDLKHYKMAVMAVVALAIDSVANTAYLSGEGMGCFVILAMCLNAEKQDRPISLESSNKDETENGELINEQKSNRVIVIKAVSHSDEK